MMMTGKYVPKKYVPVITEENSDTKIVQFAVPKNEINYNSKIK